MKESQQGAERASRADSALASSAPLLHAPQADAAPFAIVIARWEEEFGAGTFPHGDAPEALGRLLSHHAATLVAQHLGMYFARIRPQHVSLAQFVATFKAWVYVDMVDADGVLIECGDERGHYAW